VIDERGERLIDRDLLVLMKAPPRAGRVQVAVEDGRDTWLVEFDTAIQTSRRSGLRGQLSRGRAFAGLLRQPLAVRGTPVPVAKQAGGAVVARACVIRCRRSVRSRLGRGRDRDLPRFGTLGAQCGFSVVQLLPVHDVSTTGPSPYAPVSAFALDPAYLSLDACEDSWRGWARSAAGRAAPAADAAKSAERVDWSAVREVKGAGIQLAFGALSCATSGTSARRAPVSSACT